MTRAALVLALALGAGAAAAQTPCRLALALALDISSSVNPHEYALQRDGLAAALRDPEVREAMLTQDGEVWLAAFEWSGQVQQDPIFGWTPVREPADIDALAARLDAHVRPYDVFSTAVGAALRHAAALHAANPVRCDRRVVDVSGDGQQNEGPALRDIRATGALDRITVNALVIDGEWPSPVDFYRDEVIGGEGAFLLVARNGFEDYPDLIRAKLLREVAPPVLVGALPAPAR